MKLGTEHQENLMTFAEQPLWPDDANNFHRITAQEDLPKKKHPLNDVKKIGKRWLPLEHNMTPLRQCSKENVFFLGRSSLSFYNLETFHEENLDVVKKT